MHNKCMGLYGNLAQSSSSMQVPTNCQNWRENRENLVPNMKTADYCLLEIGHSQGCYAFMKGLG